MAVLNKTYIDGDLHLQPYLNDKGETQISTSYAIGGTIIGPDDKKNYKLVQADAEHKDQAKGTKRLKNITDYLSTTLGRSQKLPSGYWATSLRFDVPKEADVKKKNYWNMTFEQVPKKDANGNIIKDKDGKVEMTNGDANFSVWLMGDSIRIFARLQYEGDAEDVDGNITNSTILRIKIYNKDNLIKAVHKAAGTTAGYGTAAAVYAVNVNTEGDNPAKITQKNPATGKWDNYNYHKIATTGSSDATHIQVNQPNTTAKMCATDDNSIWIDVKLSAVVADTKTLSFFITCPVELNNIEPEVLKDNG